jgi:hypothetical protein
MKIRPVLALSALFAVGATAAWAGAIRHGAHDVAQVGRATGHTVMDAGRGVGHVVMSAGRGVGRAVDPKHPKSRSHRHG